MLRSLLAATVLATGTLGALPATAQDADTVVATVNGEEITLGQLLVMRDGLSQDMVQNMPPAALWDLMLDQMIRQTAVAQVASADLTKRNAAALEIEKRAYLAGAVLEEVAAADPTDDEVRAVYDQTFGSDDAPEVEYSAAHILVATREEAEAIKAELDNGADFGTLAEEKSTDNSSANKGDLGWFQAAQMVKPFADAVIALDKGGVSDPVESQFGWHIIKLNDERAVSTPDFSEVRDQLAIQVRRDRVQAEIEKRVEEADVQKTPDLNPELLNQSDLLGN